MTAPRVALVVAEFNREIMDAMVAAAGDEAKARGAEVIRTVRVPGSYEAPLVAQALFAHKDVDVVVVLGYIERGETQHGEVMGKVVQGALVDLSLSYNKPLGMGIIGPGATLEQARTRKESYAKAAVAAALASAAALAEHKLQSTASPRGFRA